PFDFKGFQVSPYGVRSLSLGGPSLSFWGLPQLVGINPDLHASRICYLRSSSRSYTHPSSRPLRSSTSRTTARLPGNGCSRTRRLVSVSLRTPPSSVR